MAEVGLDARGEREGETLNKGETVRARQYFYFLEAVRGIPS